MRDKSAFVTILFLIWILIASASIGIIFANTAADPALEQAKAANLQSASADSPAQGESKSNHSSTLGFMRFEPLLLLLLGSILFSSGTVINFMLSKRLKGKSIQAVTSNK